jgi:DedD protein
MAYRLREEDKITEKVEVRLDNRQIAWLIIGCAVISAIVFVSGYTIGKSSVPTAVETMPSLAALPATMNMENGAEVDPAKLAETTPSYTYDRVLSKPSPRVEINDPTHLLLANKLAEIENERAETAKADAMDMDLAGPRPVSAIEPANPRAEAPPTDPRIVPEGQATGTRNDARASSASSRKDKSGYTIQVKAFRSKQEAAKFISALRGAGHAPYMLTSDIPGKGQFYRVRLGRFETLAAASKRQSEFENLEGFKTIVTPL